MEPTACCRQTEDGSEFGSVHVKLLLYLFNVQTTAWVRGVRKKVHDTGLDSDIEGGGPINGECLLNSTLIRVLNENLETSLRSGLGCYYARRQKSYSGS
jgi:hypothetical protein